MHINDIPDTFANRFRKFIRTNFELSINTSGVITPIANDGAIKNFSNKVFYTHNIGTTVRFDESQFIDFRAWFGDTLKDGALPFNLDLEFGFDNDKLKFDIALFNGGYSYTISKRFNGDKTFVVTFSLYTRRFD